MKSCEIASETKNSVNFIDVNRDFAYNVFIPAGVEGYIQRLTVIDNAISLKIAAIQT
jgi:hypothetical protein